MSWGSGIYFVQWAMQLAKNPPFEERVRIWEKFINKLESEDCDSTSNCLEEDPAYDKAWNNIHKDDKE